MNKKSDQLTRLQFLERVAMKEIDLLLYAESKAFDPPLTRYAWRQAITQFIRNPSIA